MVLGSGPCLSRLPSIIARSVTCSYDTADTIPHARPCRARLTVTRPIVECSSAVKCQCKETGPASDKLPPVPLLICPLSISILNARPNSKFVKPFAARAFVLRSGFASPRYLSHKRPNHSNLRSVNPTSPSLALPASTLFSLVSSSHPILPVFQRLRTHTHTHCTAPL